MASNLQKRKLRHSMPTFRSSCPLTLGTRRFLTLRNLMPHSTAWGLQSLWAALVNFWESCGEGEKYFLIWTLEEDSWLPCSQHSYESVAQGIANSYPSVFLNLPVMRKLPLLPLWTVWKLEKARKHPSVLLSVWKDGILEIDSMRQEVIVLIHPNGKKRRQEL